jgi:hypothetical protein
VQNYLRPGRSAQSPNCSMAAAEMCRQREQIAFALLFLQRGQLDYVVVFPTPLRDDKNQGGFFAGCFFAQ